MIFLVNKLGPLAEIPKKGPRRIENVPLLAVLSCFAPLNESEM